MDIKSRLVRLLEGLGAFKVRVADPDGGFARALPGCHPRDVMSTCRSVVVFATNIGLDYYRVADFHTQTKRIGHLFTESLGSQAVWFLRERGYDALFPFGYYDEEKHIARISNKLAAYEAGIGVYGRPSIIITPEYGPRVNLGVILTDAPLEPDGRMQGFSPCEGCNVCQENCPAEAIGAGEPPRGFNRERCLSFNLNLRRVTGERVQLCGYCYRLCPSGKLVERTLKVSRWRSLLSLDSAEREQVIEAARRQIFWGGRRGSPRSGFLSASLT